MELVTKYDTNDAKKESLMGGSKSAKGGGSISARGFEPGGSKFAVTGTTYRVI